MYSSLGFKCTFNTYKSGLGRIQWNCLTKETKSDPCDFQSNLEAFQRSALEEAIGWKVFRQEHNSQPLTNLDAQSSLQFQWDTPPPHRLGWPIFGNSGRRYTFSEAVTEADVLKERMGERLNAACYCVRVWVWAVPLYSNRHWWLVCVPWLKAVAKKNRSLPPPVG